MIIMIHHGDRRPARAAEDAEMGRDEKGRDGEHRKPIARLPSPRLPGDGEQPRRARETPGPPSSGPPFPPSILVSLCLPASLPPSHFRLLPPRPLPKFPRPWAGPGRGASFRFDSAISFPTRRPKFSRRPPAGSLGGDQPLVAAPGPALSRPTARPGPCLPCSARLELPLPRAPAPHAPQHAARSEPAQAASSGDRPDSESRIQSARLGVLCASRVDPAGPSPPPPPPQAT